MKTTSHFIWIAIKPEIFSDVFVWVNAYLQKHDIENCISFQNPISTHITLYYLEEKILEQDTENIKRNISEFDISWDIFVTWIKYFYREADKYVLYFTSKTSVPLKKYRDLLHQQYNKTEVVENSYDFSPHITFLKILESTVFEEHRENIERIMVTEIKKLQNVNISNKNVSLYAVNSRFNPEIQIKI